MRKNANTHASIRIDGETFDAAAAAVHTEVGAGRRTCHFTLQIFPVLGSEFCPVHIKCDDFFWR
jgi:hypothetical protein